MLNRVTLMGRLTAEPEPHVTAAGNQCCPFSVAVERNTRPGEDGRRPVDFINCVAWKMSAELLAKYFHKGDMIAIEGRIQTRSWESETGQRRYATEVVVDSLYFCGGKRAAAQGEHQPAASPSAPAAPDYSGYDDEDNLPF